LLAGKLAAQNLQQVKAISIYTTQLQHNTATLSHKPQLKAVL